jgi:lipopolysaccharide export system permease protein
VLRPALLALAITVVIFSVFNLAMFLREVITGELLAEQFLYRIALRNAVAAEILLPTTFFFGMVFALASWHRDREAHAFYSAGVSPWRVERVLYGLCVVVALLALLLSVVVRPWAYRVLDALDQAAAEQATAAVLPGQFTESGGVVVTAEGRDSKSGQLDDVFAYRSIDGASEVLRSRSAQMGGTRENGTRALEFGDGESYRFDATNQLMQRIEFERLVYLRSPEPNGQSMRRKAKSLAELRASAASKDLAEYQWRFSMPGIAFMLGVFGIALGRTRPKASPYSRFAIGLLLYMGIFNLASGVRSALENEQMPAIPGLYVVPLAMAICYGLMVALRGNRADTPA